MSTLYLKNWFESHRSWLESEAQKEFDRLAGEEQDIPKALKDDEDFTGCTNEDR